MKKNKSGFTLIEIIISLSILAIASVFLVNFLAPQVTIYNDALNRTKARTVCNMTVNAIQREIELGTGFFAAASEEAVKTPTTDSTTKTDTNFQYLSYHPVLSGGEQSASRTVLDGTKYADDRKIDTSFTKNYKVTTTFKLAYGSELSQKNNKPDIVYLTITVTPINDRSDVVFSFSDVPIFCTNWNVSANTYIKQTG